MDRAVPQTVIFLGTLGLLAWWIASRTPQGVPAPGNMDSWQTPLYLRVNTPVFDTSMTVMPAVPDDAFWTTQGWAIPTYWGGS